ncbi:MAG: endolytic transglycosylase MltG, partial [Anaerolineales bacterium]
PDAPETIPLPALTFDDLELPSPYNTYLFKGLHPGPIANPGLSSLEAVGYPADTSELYFRALCDGSGRHAFAETFEQHLQNACP